MVPHLENQMSRLETRAIANQIFRSETEEILLQKQKISKISTVNLN